MKRTVFLVMGLCVLFTLPNLPREALAGQTYKVRPGDTLSGIATQRGVTLEALKRANQLTGSLITPRQVLLIPPPMQPPPVSPHPLSSRRRTPTVFNLGIR